MDTAYLLHDRDLTIPCRHTPAQCCAPLRLVLGVHGLAGSADDPIQTSLAEEMSLFCSAVFRFDFPGHGQSPHSCDDFTVDNCIRSLLEVAKEARCRYPQVEELCIFATGFGAYITLAALHMLTEMPGQVKLVIHTPSVRMDQTLLAMTGISRETFRVADTFTFPTKRPLTVSYSFFCQLQQRSVLQTQPIPILVLHSEQDAYIHMSDIRAFRQLNEQARLVIIPGTSHQFLEDGAWEMVLDLTRDWFEFEQVLLTDWE